MPIDAALRARIQGLIDSAPVVLFMKGTREEPACGFSENVVGILDQLLEEYATCDVLSDEAVHEGLKEFSGWPTYPQLYVRGELVGGSDIVSEMSASGELHAKLGVRLPEPGAPDFLITGAAASEVHHLAARLEVPQGYELRLTIDARGRNRIGFTPPASGDVVVDSGGIRIRMDAATAGRARGLCLDVVDAPRGREFRIGERA